MKDTLSILTLNCWNVSPPYEERIERIRAGIAALQPDVIGLQEIIVRPDGFDQAAQILDGLGYASVFAPAFAWDENGQPCAGGDYDFGFGNVAASRHPIRDVRRCQLPGEESGEWRAATGVIVDTPAGALPFVSTHLNWKFEHGYVRERQVVALADFADALAAGHRLPPVIAGDFNAEPDSSEVRFLKGWQSLAGRSASYFDAWQYGGDGGPGWTWDNRDPFAALVGEPNRRIDFVFVGFDHERPATRVVDSRIVMNEARDGIYPSDHFGLMAWFEV